MKWREWEYKFYVLIVYVVLITVLFVSAADGQTRRDSRRMSPGERPLPVRIGVTQVASDCGNWPWQHRCTLSNADFADEAAAIGVRAVKAWPTPWLFGSPFEDMDAFWENPDIDVYVIRPMYWTSSETSCKNDGGRSVTWENEPVNWIVKKLYEKYGHLDKTIVISNWEGDWQLRGTNCREPWEMPEPFGWYEPSSFLTKWQTNCEDLYDKYQAEDRGCPFDSPYPMGGGGLDAQIICDQGAEVACASHQRWSRAEYLRTVFNKRQAAVRYHRMQNPRARLKVLHAIVVNHPQPSWDIQVARDVIPFLDYPPDLVGLSHWKGDIAVADALTDVQVFTGLPRHRIYLDEFGAEERYEGRQYEKITQWSNEALTWGVRWVFVWNWRQYHTGKDLGITSAPGVYKSGVTAVQELIATWEER